VYNTEHHHSGLGLLTPSDVHHGLAEQRVAARAAVLATAYAAHPERFPGGLPQPPARPTEVWINPPTPHATEDALDRRAPHPRSLVLRPAVGRKPSTESQLTQRLFRQILRRIERLAWRPT